MADIVAEDGAACSMQGCRRSVLQGCATHAWVSLLHRIDDLRGIESVSILAGGARPKHLKEIVRP